MVNCWVIFWRLVRFDNQNNLSSNVFNFTCVGEIYIFHGSISPIGMELQFAICLTDKFGLISGSSQNKIFQRQYNTERECPWGRRWSVQLIFINSIPNFSSNSIKSVYVKPAPHWHPPIHIWVISLLIGVGGWQTVYFCVGGERVETRDWLLDLDYCHRWWMMKGVSSNWKRNIWSVAPHTTYNQPLHRWPDADVILTTN